MHVLSSKSSQCNCYILRVDFDIITTSYIIIVFFLKGGSSLEVLPMPFELAFSSLVCSFLSIWTLVAAQFIWMARVWLIHPPWESSNKWHSLENFQGGETFDYKNGHLHSDNTCWKYRKFECFDSLIKICKDTKLSGLFW